MIYVTGADGFVGSHLCWKLQAEGIEFKRMQCGLLSYPLLLKELKGCDIIVHLAALKDIEEGEKYPFHYFQNNVEGTFALVKAALENKVERIVFASSLAAKYTPSTYGLTKRLSEQIIAYYAESTNPVSLRFASIWDKDHGTIALFRKLDPITIYGNGWQKRDFVHVSDAVEALLMGCYTLSGCYDVGSGEGITINDLAHLYGKEVVHKWDRDPGPPYSVANPSHFPPGWKPKINFRDVIQEWRNDNSTSEADTKKTIKKPLPI